MIITPRGKKIHFGQKGSSDMTIHKNEATKQNYFKRHIVKEDFSKKGINKAGYWSRWILWNQPTLDESIKDTERRFNIKIIYKPTPGGDG